MTIDNGMFKMGADVQYRYVDPILTQTIQDLDHSLRVTGQASLTSIISTQELQFVKNEKHLIEQRLQVAICYINIILMSSKLKRSSYILL
jgi:hypothetical protein